MTIDRLSRLDLSHVSRECSGTLHFPDYYALHWDKQARALPASIIKGLLLILSSPACARIDPHLGLEVAPATAASPAAAVATATESACTLSNLLCAFAFQPVCDTSLHSSQA